MASNSRMGGKTRAGAMTPSLDESIEVAGRRDVDLISLDDALKELARFDPQQARIVELRYFTGLSIEETAEAIGISPATVKREWAVARACFTGNSAILDPRAQRPCQELYTSADSGIRGRCNRI